MLRSYNNAEINKIGRITGAQGIRGEVRLWLDSGDEESLKLLSSLFLSVDGVFKPLEIENLRMRKRTPILKLSGIGDRNTAESLIGCEIYAEKSEFKPGGDDAWFVSDLVGLDVRLVLEDGEMPKDETVRGSFSIKSVISNPAHDILEIETDKGTRLLPFIDVFVRDVDTKSGYIVIAPPDGWMEQQI